MVKGKRWKKGQSSSSNPQSKKYREAAKNTFFNFSNPNGKAYSFNNCFPQLFRHNSHVNQLFF